MKLNRTPVKPVFRVLCLAFFIWFLRSFLLILTRRSAGLEDWFWVVIAILFVGIPGIFGVFFNFFKGEIKEEKLFLNKWIYWFFLLAVILFLKLF